MELEESGTYYMITFADAEQTMPGINPLVFIGKNIFEADETSKDTYCFQDTVSYQKFGFCNEECYVHEFKSEEIGKDIVDLYQAQEIIEEAVARYRRLGEPKLQVLQGPWVASDDTDK